MLRGCVAHERHAHRKMAEVLHLCPAGRYALYLGPDGNPSQQTPEACLLWTLALMQAVRQQHEKQVEENKAAWEQIREHSRLLKQAANMSDSDYEHAWPVQRSVAQMQRAKDQRVHTKFGLECTMAQLGTPAKRTLHMTVALLDV